MYKARRPHGPGHANGAGHTTNFGVPSLAHVHTSAMSVRGDSNRPSTAGLWDSDVRRSSYFDRLSVDEARPQMPASLQTSTAGLLRRVISGLTGSSSYGAT
ncbi:hypothetical protein EC988_010334 [Linderina pennispora]|nr:hypothetical protein EC988_010334 [Linderina pennispora]